MGRNTPDVALGRYTAKRSVDATADWDAGEIVDIGIDLYDSALRNQEAELRDVEKMRRLLEKDRSWKKAHAELDEEAYEAALTADAQRAAEVPQWFMRPELRGFDYIHPNAEGHRAIAQVTCPSLPESWGCDCAAL
jgi:methylmalonyl-CoA mutase N-terminal domain/subunit